MNGAIANSLQTVRDTGIQQTVLSIQNPATFCEESSNLLSCDGPIQKYFEVRKSIP